jgi:hypothetical protein
MGYYYYFKWITLTENFTSYNITYINNGVIFNFIVTNKDGNKAYVSQVVEYDAKIFAEHYSYLKDAEHEYTEI